MAERVHVALPGREISSEARWARGANGEPGKWIKKRWKGNSDKKLRVHRSLFALVNTTRLSAKVTNEREREREKERERSRNGHTFLPKSSFKLSPCHSFPPCPSPLRELPPPSLCTPPRTPRTCLPAANAPRQAELTITNGYECKGPVCKANDISTERRFTGKREEKSG